MTTSDSTPTTEAERAKAAIASGPAYPDLGATVAKLRGKANRAGGIREMLPSDRRAYGESVLKAIRAKNRAPHMRPTPSPTAGWYSPPSISRLLRYENPIMMVGDPDWKANCKHGHYGTCTCPHWANREKAVYAHMMGQKRAAAPIRQAEDIFA